MGGDGRYLVDIPGTFRLGVDPSTLETGGEEETGYRTWAGPVDLRTKSIEVSAGSNDLWEKVSSVATNKITTGGDGSMNLYKYVILDRSTGIRAGEGWVTGEDREQAMAAVPTHDYSLDKIKVFLKKFGSYEPIE